MATQARKSKKSTIKASNRKVPTRISVKAESEVDEEDEVVVDRVIDVGDLEFDIPADDRDLSDFVSEHGRELAFE